MTVSVHLVSILRSSDLKRIPNIITALRILGAACLLLCNPAGVAFWVIYGLCGISDMLDGYLALDPRGADSDMAVDMGRGNRRHQDRQSGFCTNCLQTLLLSTHRGQQIDRSPALHSRAYGVLVHCPHSLCGWRRHIRRHSGRPLYPDTEARFAGQDSLKAERQSVPAARTAWRW